MGHRLRILGLVSFVGLSSLFIGPPAVRPHDKIMGQIQFVDATKVAKASGVWVDGQYVGYLGELKGSSRLRLLPGEHRETDAGGEDPGWSLAPHDRRYRSGPSFRSHASPSR